MNYKIELTPFFGKFLDWFQGFRNKKNAEKNFEKFSFGLLSLYEYLKFLRH